MGKKVVDAATAAQNYQSGMAGASAKYKQGIQRYQGNPMAEAATPDAEARYLQNVTAASTSGKRARALQAVPVSRWRDNAMTEGANRLTSGAAKAKDKVAAHFQAFTPVYQAASDAANALPKGGIGNAVARVQAALQVMMSAAGSA